jgi:hypothetical protein
LGVIIDKLIGYLSRYIGTLSAKEAALFSTEDVINNWDSSEELRLYAGHTRFFRGLAQFVSFAVIPASLSITRISRFGSSLSLLEVLEVVGNILLWLATVWLIVKAHILRRKTGHVFFDSQKTKK